MAIFRKKSNDPLLEQSQQIEKEIAKINAEIKRLQQLENSRANAVQLHRKQENCRLFIEGHQEFLDSTENPKTRKLRESDQIPTKYDLFGELRKRIGLVKKNESEKTKLIQTLMAGSLQGPPLLKYEQRIARNRFLLVFVIFIIILIGLLSLFTKIR